MSACTQSPGPVRVVWFILWDKPRDQVWLPEKHSHTRVLRASGGWTTMTMAWEKPSALSHFHWEDRLTAWLPGVTVLCDQPAPEGRWHWPLTRVTCFWSTFALPWLTSKKSIYTRTWTENPKSDSLLWFILQTHPRSIDDFILNKCIFHGYKINHLFYLFLIQKYVGERNNTSM